MALDCHSHTGYSILLKNHQFYTTIDFELILFSGNSVSAKADCPRPAQLGTIKTNYFLPVFYA
ncbi:MAG: hypothetical protein CTY29_01730 [Methylobacter sp.]|nr:MAG: hypothetical protein CTY29_01730 [Methylobacter sp.]PPD19858.1 MAG: hypothetical protein CTY24_10115 [Methylobacter sp.]PPD36855.1 MAG: hypothetical protein CTY18_03465 [Methylomonas sp.]